MLPENVCDWIRRECHRSPLPGTARPVGGGCIHEAILVDTREGGSLFLKRNRPDRLALFEAELAGLGILAGSGTIRVPRPFACGVAGDHALLAMEGLDLRGQGDPAGQERLAERLAALHDTTSPDGRFGADFDNHIGSTPQSNRWCDSWADFFVTERLEAQFRLATDRGRRFASVDRLLAAVHGHLSSVEIRPSLLHGDLWGGNVGFLANGEPVVFDPAVYHGDRETDLAFTRLFGGFGPAFHRRYRELVPAPEPVREPIYNLYHLLNHDHLFGGGYGSQAERAIADILRQL